MKSTASHSTTAAPSPAIRVNNLWHSYDGVAQGMGLSVPHWEVARGQRVFLCGDSGSGKSTLLNLLAGILTPTRGTIELLGQPFSNLGGRRRDRFRARHLGVVFQRLNLIPYLSVLQNIQLAGYFGGSRQAEGELAAAELLSRLRLPAGVLHQRADILSVGQQQRVAIARALVGAPEVLLVDEPTSALDASARDAFMQILVELCRDTGTTLVFVSHDLSLRDFFDTSIEMATLSQPPEIKPC